MKSDTAGSDIVAVMALIAIFVTVAAISMVALLSHPIGDAAPAMIARNATVDGKLCIYHDGGDPLEWGHFEILVDGARLSKDDISLVDAFGATSSDWTSWKTGEALVLGSVPDNAHIQIVGEGVGRTGGDWLLHDIGDGKPAGTVLEPPAAAFIANVTEGNAPLAVQFTDQSAGNVTAWVWNFGDGNTSTDQHPEHTYESAGTYTVTLNVSNAYGFSIETKAGYITALEPPAANFTANVTEGNAPLAVQFTDQSAGDITDWFWDFGDGNTSTEQHPAYTYESAGNYTVTLNVSNTYGFSIETKAGYITVLAPPAANFTANVTEGNAPLAVQFTDESAGSVTAWFWDFGDGNTSTDQHPAYTYESAGTYTVTLNASNTYGFSIETKAGYITVLAPPAAAFTANVTEGNAPLAVQFSDQSAGDITDWFWNFGDGTTSTDQHPEHTYESAGTYTVTLNVSNAYGFSIETKAGYITVLAPPAAAFSANVTEGNAPLAVQFTDQSAGDIADWFWDFGDGNTSTEQNPAYTYESAGTYTVTLTASNTYGNNTLTRSNYIQVTVEEFIDFVVEESVFVYGNTLQFSGGNVNGPNATIVITGDLVTTDTNLGASINVSNIYIDGSVSLNHGSAGLGSPTNPGNIYVNGDLELWNGGREVYGDVYVNGSFRLKDAKIYGDVYVNGDLTLDWTPTLGEGVSIYYTGTLTIPDNYASNSNAASVLAKCIHSATVQGFNMPDHEIPSTKPSNWYEARNYVSYGELEDGVKIFAASYTSGSGKSAENIIIIAYDGDISITGGWSTVTGVFFAPKGKVTFSGGNLEGVVIARDGFHVSSGGTKVTFKNIEEYISDPADYPF